MNVRDRYDEIYNIVDTLETLSDEVNDRYYKEMIDELRMEAQGELEELEEELNEIEKAERLEEERQFNEMRI